ncbi:MAG: dephospho-CoA kinase [Bacteroidales bacterium]|nr:dephospho-CoA kinase [Bacteroidales bacterium]
MGRLIAIAGGIGSGKSVVSSIIRILGYKVYDCDSEAKRLMNTNTAIQGELVENFGPQSVLNDGTINKKYISSVVFGNEDALNKLNSIVHPRVKDDIVNQAKCVMQSIMFVETAILLQSNLFDIIDDVWVVEAPENVRINRVMKRNAMCEEDVIKRIKAQDGQDYNTLKSVKTIVNDGVAPLFPQVEKLVKEILK